MIMKEPVLKTMRSLVGFPARMPPYTQMLSPTAAALCLRLLRATPLIAKHSQVRDTVGQWKCHHSAVWLCFILPQCKRQQKGQAQTKLMASSFSSTSCNTLTCYVLIMYTYLYRICRLLGDTHWHRGWTFLQTDTTSLSQHFRRNKITIKINILSLLVLLIPMRSNISTQPSAH